MLFATSANAAITPGDGLILFTGGWLSGRTALTEETIDGNSFTFSYERLDWGKPASFWFAIGYGTIFQERHTLADDAKVSYNIDTMPIYLGGKGWLGEGNLQGYFGLGLGIYFSNTQRTTVDANGKEDYASFKTSGLGLGVPLGLTLGLGKTLFLNANYTLNWLWDNDALKDNLLHAVNVGVGFNLGK
jgi:hypothetical protein